MKKIVQKLIKKKDNTCWNQVKYPPSSPWKLFGFIPLRVLLISCLVFLEVIITMIISDKIHNNIGQLLLIIISFYIIYKTIINYKRFQRMIQTEKNINIENNLMYLIHTNRFYDEEIFEIEESDSNVRIRVKKGKRIVRAIKIYYKEDDSKVYIRIAKLGDRFTIISSNLRELLESSLGLELDNKISNVDYCEYIFLKHKKDIKQFTFSTSYPLDKTFFKNIPLDIIYLSNLHSFSLKKNTNLGIYGRTGTGKTIALQWYLYNAVAKGCGTTADSVLSIVDGKGADLFSLGEMLQQTLGENINIGQTPTSLAKLSREFVQIMNNRFEEIKNSNVLNADGYDLGNTPNFLFVDELASIKDSCGSDKKGKELWNEILQNLGLIARKGRQASCHLCIATQDPNSENIPVEIRSQISSVLYLGNPSNDRLKMAFSMCELENVPTISGRKGEALFYADGNNMIEPAITIVPFVDIKTKQDFINIIREIKPII
ncbi:FtsK/SpoIIIE domain-containing protein [Clostridium sp. VAP23]|uniref:FtsK/SpoIIIE domain-containing protein n=1 Tax=Clostridium sp. VAP23 TaxID=2949981 RepID=UPI002079DA94|nr:FtsK/SpoIIIE domain-containing protein [Clostridium sp. VAP23]